MKILHCSDLHLGKRVKEFNLIPDQEYILKQILRHIRREKPEVLLLAGDIYDKSVPSAEAVSLFDQFLVDLAALELPTIVISGNHDSPERLAFGGRLMESRRIHLSPVYDGHVEPVLLEDAFGPVAFWPLPFLKPAHVRRFFPEEETESYTKALAAVIAHLPLDPEKRNVLITHQFVTGAARCESEEISVGGADNVDLSVFTPFDYVALGHIHGPQNLDGPRVRYCGTPLKYSFSEAGQEKSLSLVTLGEKGSLELKTLPLTPLHDMRVLRGSYMELSARDFYQGTATDDYLHITLTDEEEVPEAMGKLRVIYPNLMSLEYDNTRSRSAARIEAAEDVERRSPLELFGELYEKQNNQPMSEPQLAYARALMERIWEESP